MLEMTKKLLRLLKNSKEIKNLNYVLFPTLNDKFFELYSSEMSSVKSYILTYYHVDVDEIHIVNNISCIYSKQEPMQHIVDSRSIMQIIETKEGKNVALIYFSSGVEEI
jgi:hypothetical protein